MTTAARPIATEPHLRRQARGILADQMLAKGAAWANTADAIRRGNWGNAFTEAGIAAIEAVLKLVPQDEDDEE